MTDLNEMMTESENFSDPVKFQEMLGLARGGQPEEEEIEEEETQEEVEESPAIEEAPAEEVKPKDDGINIPKYRFDQSQAEAREYKAKYNELVALVEEMVKGKQQPEPEEEFEPIDEVAHKKYSKEIEEVKKETAEIKQQAQMRQMVEVLTTQENVARQKYADYDTAFQHYTQSKLQEVMALGYSEAEAQQVVQAGLLNTAVGAVNNQRQVGEVFYSLAKAAGYKPLTASKPDKLEENRAKTERKPSERAAPDTSNGDVISQFRSMAKKGTVSNDDFNKLLARARGEK